MKGGNTIILISLSLLILMSSFAFAADPVLYYKDIDGVKKLGDGAIEMKGKSSLHITGKNVDGLRLVNSDLVFRSVDGSFDKYVDSINGILAKFDLPPMQKKGEYYYTQIRMNKVLEEDGSVFDFKIPIKPFFKETFEGYIEAYYVDQNGYESKYKQNFKLVYHTDVISETLTEESTVLKGIFELSEGLVIKILNLFT